VWRRDEERKVVVGGRLKQGGGGTKEGGIGWMEGKERKESK